MRSRDTPSSTYSQIDLEQGGGFARSVSSSGTPDLVSSPNKKVMTILRNALQIRVLCGYKM